MEPNNDPGDETMKNPPAPDRRAFLMSAAGTGLAALSGVAAAQSFEFKPNQRYPDPAVQILDPAFARYRIYSSTLEQVATGMRWAEGPVYFPGGRLPAGQRHPEQPDHEIQREGRQFHRLPRPGQLRQRQHPRPAGPAHHLRAFGHPARHPDREGRQGHRPGRQLEGKRLNAPNDIVVKSDDSIWFTDPIFGINGEWEGSRAKPDQATTNVYRIGSDGKIAAVLNDLVNPNGLAFSPDEKKLYVVEWKGTPNRSIWSYDVGSDGATLGNKTKLIDAADQGALDGFRVDRDGNLWCGWGSNGALQAEPSDVGGRKVFQLRGRSEDLDGVMVFNPQGKPLAHIRLPERCANLCFGGPKNNRLYMTACHSVYALYVEAHGAT